MGGTTGSFVQIVAHWQQQGAAYRVRAIHHGDGAVGLVIEVFGPGTSQRSAVVRGDVGELTPLLGGHRSSDGQRTAVVEALFDASRWC